MDAAGTRLVVPGVPGKGHPRQGLSAPAGLTVRLLSALSLRQAGIICQLNARTSILAAANPIESQWNPKKTTIENIQLPHTLLSRYDSTCSSNRWFYFTYLWKVQGEGEKEITRINTANRHLFMAVCSACLLSHGS